MHRTVNGRAIIALVISNIFFLISDSFTKLISAQLPAGELMAMRGVLISIPFFVILCGWSGSWRQWRILLQPRVIARAGTEGAISVLYITGLAQLPIANATALFQTLPLAITAVSALALGENVGPRHWMAIVAGFFGTLLIVKPDLHGFNSAALLILASVAVAVVRDLLTRGMPNDMPSDLVSVGTGIGVTLCGAVLAPTEVWQPLDWRIIAELFGTGIAVSTGWVLLVNATKLGDLSVVSPFRYTMLIWAVISGIFVFQEWPDTLSIIGMAVISLCGVYILVDQSRKALAA